MSKEVGGMVGSRRVTGAGSARPESAPTARRLGREPWHPASGGAQAGNETWCLRLLHGESLDAVSRELGLEVYRLEAWKARAVAG